MAYTLNTTDLGTVEDESQEPSSDLEVEGFPMSGSKDTQALDYSGVKRTISLQGKVSATSATNLVTNFIKPIDLLQNGNQGVVVYHSQFLENAGVSGFYANGNINVKVQRFRWTIKGGTAAYCTYSIELVESI